MNNKPVKSLGRTSSKLLLALGEKDKSIFTTAEAREVIGTSPAATRNLLSDLVEKRWLIRLTPGRYLVVPLSAGESAEYSENWYVVARYLVEPRPYYLSHYSALDIHKMTTQPLHSVFVTSPVRRRNVDTLGASFYFVFIHPSRFWGTEDVWVKPTQQVHVSDLERTVVDCLSNPGLCGGVSELAKGLWARRNDIDYPKLMHYVERFDSKAVAKRLGFLLELYEIGGDAVEGLKKYVVPSYVLLDPSLPPRGKYKSSWKLRINIDPEELKDITAT